MYAQMLISWQAGGGGGELVCFIFDDLKVTSTLRIET